MPNVALQKAEPSTLATVIGQVVDAFQQMADATPVMVGKQYLEDFGTGSPPRVLFIPEERGSIGPPLELGAPASISHACRVFIRGVEGGDDLTRFDPTYELTELVVSCIAVAASGRITWGDFADSSPVNVDGYGAELSGSFTYARDLRHSAKRWGLAPATEDGATVLPLLPSRGVGIDPAAQAQPGVIDKVTATTEPQEQDQE